MHFFNELLVLSLDAVTVSACIAWLILRGGKRSAIKSKESYERSGSMNSESSFNKGAESNNPSSTDASASILLDEIDLNQTVISPPLTPDERNALSGLRSKLRSNNLLEKLGTSMQVAAESRNHYLLRFLKARKMNVNLAFEMIREDLKWRDKIAVNEIASKTASEVLGCEIADIWPYTPQWMQGEDRLGRPLIYKEWGNFHFGKIKEKATLENMVAYHLWMNEQACRKLGVQSIKYGKRIDKFVCVFNADNFTPSCMRNGAMTFLKEIAGMDQSHYPERLGVIIVVNAPRLISLVWNVVRTYLDPVTRDKIHIHASETEWRPIIDKLIDRDNLVDTLGGNAPVEFPTGQPIELQNVFLDELRPQDSSNYVAEASDSLEGGGNSYPKKSVVGRQRKRIPKMFKKTKRRS